MDYNFLKNAHIAGLHKEEITVGEKCGSGDLNRMMQQATETAMGRLGVSIEELQKEQLLWVICFSQIEIFRMPKAGESISVYTWPGAEKMGMFTRKYVFFTQNGEELVNASSLFSLANQETRTMVLPSEAGFIFPVVQLAGEPKVPKLTARGSEGEGEKVHLVIEDEIDHNGHVNNAFYLDWAQDIIVAGKPELSDQVRNIWIGYSKEVLKDDSVVMKYSLDTDGLFLRGYVNNESCFTIKCSL